MRALVCGISGQDGSLLADLLGRRGYEVCGTSRDVRVASFANLDRLGIRERVETLSMSPLDFQSVSQVLRQFEPDEIYFLAGQSSVGLSFEQPIETFESIAVGTINLLEAIRLAKLPVRLFNAGSGECFGDTGKTPATEETPFCPRSPYATAKAASVWMVANYREAYGLYACSGILFNHESFLRSPQFVTKKVVSAACRIANGSGEKLRLGNLEVQRDWGWAPEYVEAMQRMLQREEAQDFVIATGKTHSLQDFVARAFEEVGLDWQDHVLQDRSLFRTPEIPVSRANPAKAEKLLDWQAEYEMTAVVRMMVEAERARP